jgi:hypothetical protein
MIFTIHPDGKTYPIHDEIEALEYCQMTNPSFNYLFCINISNNLQV